MRDRMKHAISLEDEIFHMFNIFTIRQVSYRSENVPQVLDRTAHLNNSKY